MAKFLAALLVGTTLALIVYSDIQSDKKRGLVEPAVEEQVDSTNGLPCHLQVNPFFCD